MQWLQDPNKNNVDNTNNVRCEASRHLQNKKKEYLKVQTDDVKTNIKTTNIRDLYRGINDFKKGYQPRTNVVKDEKGNLVTDSLSILARWRNHFSQQLNVHGVNHVRQTEIHTAEPLVPMLSASEVKVAIEKLKRHKSPSTDQIRAKLIKASGMAIHYEIHKLINGIWKGGIA